LNAFKGTEPAVFSSNSLCELRRERRIDHRIKHLGPISDLLDRLDNVFNDQVVEKIREIERQLARIGIVSPVKRDLNQIRDPASRKIDAC